MGWRCPISDQRGGGVVGEGCFAGQSSHRDSAICRAPAAFNGPVSQAAGATDTQPIGCFHCGFLALLHGSTRCHDTVPEVSGINGSRGTNRWSVSCETWGSPTKPPCLCFLHVEFDQSRFAFQDHRDVRPVLVIW